MTNIEKLIEKYGIEVVKRIPEEQGHLSYTMIYGVQISMSELIEHLKMSEYIASYKHLTGCEVCHQVGTSLYTNIITSVSDCKPFGTSGVVHDARGLYENQLPFNLLKFYLDENATGSYEEYMQLHYPEYVNVWKHQL